MKCSKCGYLGFETGDRCKNCGYDFSLMTREETPGVPDVTIRPDQSEAASPDLCLDHLDRWRTESSRPSATGRPVAQPAASPVAPPPGAPDFALPLFGPYGPDDAPLIALPTSPRPPLAVRRTPESPRLHPGGPPQADRKTSAGRVAVARDRDVRTRVGDPRLRAASVPKFAPPPELALNFHEEVVAAPEVMTAPEEPLTVPPVGARAERIAGRRLAAVAIDLALLFAIDLAIVYFTLRIAGLTMSEWAVVPPVPLLMFLMLLKLAYFSAFTAVGGQTIGKMAVGIRVIAEGRDSLDGSTAIQRTLAGVLSVVTLGLGFVPALVGSDRRALHDRLSRTRVVASA